MSLSRTDFTEACRAFVRVWDDEGCGVRGEEKDGKQEWDGGVRLLRSHDETLLRITKVVPLSRVASERVAGAEAEDGVYEEEGHVLREEDDDDDGELRREQTGSEPLRVLYDVVYSTSYQVPVLYLTFEHLLQPGLPSLEQVYELLVPSEVEPQLRALGVMGSLSFAEHPMTGLPAYFVHPCRTAEAMRSVVGDEMGKPESYLLAWLGMVGASVGLKVSIQFVQRIAAVQSS